MNLVFGFYKKFFLFLKIRGIGYRSIFSKKGLHLKLGFSHRVVIAIRSNIKLYYVSRRLSMLISRDLYRLKNLVEQIQNIKKRSTYKKKGVYLKGMIFRLKPSGKKSRF
jgi:ribosomal protein L6P/L9E